MSVHHHSLEVQEGVQGRAVICEGNTQSSVGKFFKVWEILVLSLC